MNATAPLAYRDFRLYLIGRTLQNFALRMVTVGVGWQIYDLTNNPLALGYVGLAVFIPQATFVLPAGDIIDRVDRRIVLCSALSTVFLAVCALLTLTANGVENYLFYYAPLSLLGVGQAFIGPSMASYIPFLVPREQLQGGVNLTTTTNQLGTIVGPVLGGFIYLLGPEAVYATAAALYLIAIGTFALISNGGARKEDATGNAIARLRLGVVYVRTRPIILGGMSLDLFAVLLGSVNSLLPIFAKDILQTGPEGLGMLRSSIAVGAVLAGLAAAQFPVNRHAGLTMFGAVTLFGLFAVAFALSTDFTLSMIALAAMGAANLISVNVRQTLVQLATPDDMRGRVSAVGSFFTGASNELGDFESGVVAAWLGAAPAAMIGGLGTVAVAGLWMYFFPELRRVDRLIDVRPETAQRPARA